MVLVPGGMFQLGISSRVKNIQCTSVFVHHIYSVMVVLEVRDENLGKQ
jgi:hypothetical protein